MNERGAQIEAAFHAAQDCSSPEERERYLAGLGAADPELRREVEVFLNSADAADAVFSAVGEAMERALPDELPGRLIGEYQLLGKIGEGGMGVVYKAEQQKPVRRTVALKIIKLGMDTRQVVARFEAERQALALMDHPNIATVFDGGATSSGRPYFVMELVEGVAITEFCRENQLPLEARLALFATVCQAVQHAHQKGIIHRDLKPSNVLVAMRDGAAVPKVIDFGVAKATNQALTEKTLFTHQATMIGTPAYMSPEQAEMSGLDVDTRSDIYSLGVILYELLTGTPPFSEKRLRSMSYSEMQRIITQEAPERPSTRLRRLAAGVPPSSLVRARSSLVSELDWIVMKCLAKDRNQRYETANGLAADLKRYLADEPIMARPPSQWYEFCKTVRRHRTGFAATAAVILALAAGVMASTWQAGKAREQRELARRERLRAEKEAARAVAERTQAEKSLQATLELMSTAFQEVVPDLNYTIGASKPRNSLTLAGAEIVKKLLDGAEPTAEMRQVVGQLYLNLAQGQVNYVGTTTGQYAEGLESVHQAIRFLKPVGADPSDTQKHLLAEAEMWAVFAARGVQRFDEAFQHLEEMRRWSEMLTQSRDMVLADRGRQKLQWVRWMTADTLEQMGRTEEALTNYHLPLLAEIRTEKHNGPDYRAVITRVWDLRDSFNSIGRCLLRLGRPEEALEYLRQAIPLAEELAAKEPSNSAHASMRAESNARLGEALLCLDQSGEGLPLFTRALEQATTLERCDPANPGFVQVHVNVLQMQASGYLGWSRVASASPSARAERLGRAQQSLEQAEALVNQVKSKAFQQLLRATLAPTSNQLRQASANHLSAN